ncbi:MAG: hypothetical protein EBV05_12470, partial [Cyanobacteria bacterium WB6_1B_304]|nr:hypothetical protein [Cyanobacteria bacterium WB6_1B_304]
YTLLLLNLIISLSHSFYYPYYTMIGIALFFTSLILLYLSFPYTLLLPKLLDLLYQDLNIPIYSLLLLIIYYLSLFLTSY